MRYPIPTVVAAPSVSLRRRGRLRGRHHVEPVRVALGAPVQGVLEDRLDAPGDRPAPAVADRQVVDLANRRQLGGGAGHEDLVGVVELAAGYVALNDLVAEVV